MPSRTVGKSGTTGMNMAIHISGCRGPAVPAVRIHTEILVIASFLPGP